MRTLATQSIPGLDPALAQRLITRIADDASTNEDYAQRILDQALTFIDYAGRVGQMCSPSPDVDEGWHAFILYTQEYAAHSQQHYGRFIQHMPDDDPDKPSVGPTFVQTAHDLAAAGYGVDWDLWTTTLAPHDEPSSYVRESDRWVRAHVPIMLMDADGTVVAPAGECHDTCLPGCHTQHAGCNVACNVCSHTQTNLRPCTIDPPPCTSKPTPLSTGCYPGLLVVDNDCHINEPQCNGPDCFSTNTDEDDERVRV